MGSGFGSESKLQFDRGYARNGAYRRNHDGAFIKGANPAGQKDFSIAEVFGFDVRVTESTKRLSDTLDKSWFVAHGDHVVVGPSGVKESS